MHLKFIKTRISAQSKQSNFIMPSVRVHNRIDIDTNHREEDDWEGGVICEDSVLYSANMRIKEKCYSSRESSVFTYLLHDVFVINVTNDVINYDNVIRIHS